MQKIKRELYTKMINSILSRLELYFLFYLAMRCDADGKVVGVYYHTLSKDLGCSVAKFYHLRDSLTKKGFISWEKNNSADIDFILIGNQFSKKISNGQHIREEVFYDDYVDINIAIFHDEKFFQCRAGAIQLAMYFINRVEAQGAVTEENSASRDQKKGELSRKLWYTPYKDYSDLANMLHVSVRILKQYLEEELSEWISIGHNIIVDDKEKDIVTVKRKALLRTSYKANDNTGADNSNIENGKKKKKEKTYPERYQYIHYVKTFCRRQGITYEKEDMLLDTADLILQYRGAASKKERNIFNLLARAIQNSASAILNSFNVHMALKNLLEYAGN